MLSAETKPRVERQSHVCSAFAICQGGDIIYCEGVEWKHIPIGLSCHMVHTGPRIENARVLRVQHRDHSFLQGTSASDSRKVQTVFLRVSIGKGQFRWWWRIEGMVAQKVVA